VTSPDHVRERGPPERPQVVGPAITRATFFFAFWLAISGWKTADLPVGLLATAAATWANLVLLPPEGARLRFGALTALALSFFRGSVLAGFHVAKRALSPQLDLRRGFVTVPLRLPPGNARNAFCALASLLPGTLPVGMDEYSLLVHGLDIDQPIVQDLAKQEAQFMRMLGDE
jgi:multicomponent Na+:H+ antiporter subunit E